MGRPAALLLGLGFGALLAGCGGAGGPGSGTDAAARSAAAGDSMAVRARDHAIRALTTFDTGKVTRLPGGRTLREYWVEARNAEIEVAPGVRFPAWTYNGAVPGPSLRCTEGDSVVVHFSNRGTMPHSMHFHGIHSGRMDGVFEQVAPGGSYEYAFNAEPFGLHLYHCHTMPVKMHIARGLYGVFLVDPKKPRPPAREMVMVMNGFDVYPTGTSLTPSVYTDVVTMGQGERAILEFTYKHTGRFLFHAHQSEFAELGWLGQFEVKP